MYTLLKQSGHARRGVFQTVHGTVQTPAFMNVATAGAIKGGISSYDLKELHCQVQLCNTYHLHLRPGENIVKQLGGLHNFTGWKRPILTDSGGFQVFSLGGAAQNSRRRASLRLPHRRQEDFHGTGGEHADPVDISASTIAMAFDECIESSGRV